MYAIVEIAGQQFKVEKDRYLYTHRLAGEEGAALVFDQVLLVDNDGAVQVGAPTVAGVTVTGKILEHVRGEKVIVFKKKRRKGYQKQNGHRQDLTKVLIEDIAL
jgi:large subunit ribosomal protein L21